MLLLVCSFVQVLVLTSGGTCRTECSGVPRCSQEHIFEMQHFVNWIQRGEQKVSSRKLLTHLCFCHRSRTMPLLLLLLLLLAATTTAIAFT